MCRLAAYVGPPAPLGTLLYDAPHALEHQAYAPRQMLMGHVNVDGTGVAWWPEPGGEPLRYVSEHPPWSDPNLPALSRRLTATTALAAVRSASPDVPFGPGLVAPFTFGRLAFVHNGWLGRFREGTGRELASRLPDHLYGALNAVSDSLVVFLTFVRVFEQAPGDGLASALRRTVSEVVAVCQEAGTFATLNLVVADGEGMAAVRTSFGTEGNNPLHLLQGGVRWPGGTLLASEPLDDDPAWEPLADDHVVDVTTMGATVSRLEMP